MTKYRLEVAYQDYKYNYGWYWVLHKFDEDGIIVDSRGSTGLYLFKWTAILGGKHAARKQERSTPYTKEFTI